MCLLHHRIFAQLSCLLLFEVLLSSLGCHPEIAVPETSNPELAADVKMAVKGRVTLRCGALERLGDYWSNPTRISAGFSDLPVNIPQPPAKSIPLADIDAIATVVQLALVDENDKVREEAAICLCKASQSSPAVDTAIAVALQSKDPTVMWYLSQIGSQFVLPDPAPFVANLVYHLKAPDAHGTLYLIERYGKRFTPHTAAVVHALDDIPVSERQFVLLSLSRTGISEAAANQLVRKAATENAETKAATVVALIPFPDQAAQVLHDHPGLGPSLSEIDSYWYEILFSQDPEQQKLREALGATPGIGPMNLGIFGSPHALPALRRELQTASDHHQSILRASIRACGGELGEVIHLSRQSPVRFQPASAWPKADPRRRTSGTDFGCGITVVLVTGELVLPDGTHPATVEFLRLNDDMLLGIATQKQIPRKYEPTTGRFVFRTSIFAAYSSDGDDVGPYQTGSAQVQISSPDCKSLVIQFFDEMPHVVIEMEPK